MGTNDLQPHSKAWYNNKILLIILFFILPPLGIYAMTKHKTVIWKKIVYIIPASLSVFLLLMILIATILSDDYKTAMTFYKNKNYMEAYKYFNRVSPDDENYNDAVVKLKELQPKFDSLVLAEKKKELEESYKNEIDTKKLTSEDIKELRNFQIKWSEEIVKNWQGDYFKSSSVSNSGDTINFQLIKIASTGNWQSSAEMNREIYQKEYDSLLKQNFRNKYNLLRTKIFISPDPGQQKINNVKQERRDKIHRQFSAWDGSHSKLKKLVKDAMNDPSSFDHVNTSYEDKGSYILVQMSFRGTNSFGAKVLNSVIAKVDLDGNVLSVSNN